MSVDSKAQTRDELVGGQPEAGASAGSSVIEHNRIFVNGAWVRASSSETIAVVNPATEQTIAVVRSSTSEDVDKAVQAAATAFGSWAQTPVDERAQMIGELARLMEARGQAIAETIVREVGQPIGMAVATQFQAPVLTLNIIAKSLPEIAWREQVGPTQVRREPAGVVGAITPWNVPLLMICMKAGAAIAAGCTVVLKGSEIAPLSSFIFAELAAEAGIPPGVLNLVTGTGPDVGEAVVRHPLVEMVSLTGSVRAGRRVMELAAASIKRVGLELGGKSANIVLDGADFERAIPDGITDAFRNNGQACGGLTRLLVPRSRLQEAEALAVEAAESFIVGDPFDPATTLGPVTTKAQRDRIRGLIESGTADGAQLLTGGQEQPEGLERGYYIKPTVFTTNNQTRIAREEIFGPVVVIIPFTDEADAIAIANDSPYGLGGGVWAADIEHAREVAGQLRVGRVRINGSAPNRSAPHGGFKLSGIGREWGRFGIEEFLDYKSVG